MKTIAVISLALLALGGAAFGQPPATTQPAATQPAVSSKPITKDGLQVTVTLPKATFVTGEPIKFSMEFKNVADKPVNLLNADGYHYRGWQIRFKKQGQGGWGDFGFDQAGELKLSVVQVEPGRALTVPIVLEGADLKGIARILSGGAQEQLRPGKYLLAVKMELRNNAENDPTPAVKYWAGQISTEAVEFEITDKPTTQPATQPVDAKAVGEFIRQLGDNDFGVREAATKKLMEMGEGVRPLLVEKAKEQNLDPEVAGRIKTILADLDRQRWAVLTGRVTDQRGRPLEGSWSVLARIVDGSGHPVAVDPVMSEADGTFVFRLPPGSVCQWVAAGDATWAGRTEGPFRMKVGETCGMGIIKLLPVNRKND